MGSLCNGPLRPSVAALQKGLGNDRQYARKVPNNKQCTIAQRGLGDCRAKPAHSSPAVRFCDLKPYRRAVHALSRPRRSLWFRCSASQSEDTPVATNHKRLDEIAYLSELKRKLENASTLEDKHSCLDQDDRVRAFTASLSLEANSKLRSAWEQLDQEQAYHIKCLPAIGQGHVLENSHDLSSEEVKLRLQQLLYLTDHLETFYDFVGGILGYQLTALELIDESDPDTATEVDAGAANAERIHFHVPAGPDLSNDEALARQAANWGLEALPFTAEMYPLGGAGDRLGLVDEVTGESLPAALLPYCGRSMLEGLIRDLEAREYLYFKLFGVQHTTPVAIMTSAAKRNHERVLHICKEMDWFGRSEDSFRLVQQDLVPVVTTVCGEWRINGCMEPELKPGGHGVLWKLARDKGVFQWFKENKREAAIVRQISNPMAGTDSTLLALGGMGYKQKKALGFASCERNVGATEGMNVLIERQDADGGWSYGVSNVEYTEFERLGITDEVVDGATHSRFPANTNILYIGLEAVEKAMQENGGRAALPGMLVNLTKVPKPGELRGGRLECSMQSIAEFMLEHSDTRRSADNLDGIGTFVTFNRRSRVTGSAKKKYVTGSGKVTQTPQGSFRTLQSNARELLEGCGMVVPEVGDVATYLERGPGFLAWLHPSLGPLWSVIQQKIHGGELKQGAELGLDIAEVALEDVVVDGCLQITAENVLGQQEAREGGAGTVTRFGEEVGRCRLRGVTVENAGVAWDNENNAYWKARVQRLEECRIVLHGQAEFEAADVTISGAHTFEVPDGFRMSVSTAEDGGFRTELEPLVNGNPSWRWQYSFPEDSSGEIELVMEEAEEVEVEEPSAIEAAEELQLHSPLASEGEHITERKGWRYRFSRWSKRARSVTQGHQDARGQPLRRRRNKAAPPLTA